MPDYCVGDFMYAGQTVRAVDDGKKAQHDNKREVGCDKAHEWLCLLSYQKLNFFKSVYEKILLRARSLADEKETTVPIFLFAHC
jgi:hypothetical protein